MTCTPPGSSRNGSTNIAADMKSVSKLELPMVLGTLAFLILVSALAIAATRRAPPVEVIQGPNPYAPKPAPELMRTGETPAVK